MMNNTHKLMWKVKGEDGDSKQYWKHTNSSRFQEDVRSLSSNKSVFDIRCVKL